MSDLICCRAEDDPTGQVQTGMIDGAAVLTAQIWEVYIGGRCIETTAEHPFYLVGNAPGEYIGWTPVNRLKEGDLLLGRGALPMAVERVVQTDRTATVYSLRVEPHHTFFVGDEDWRFSLWVHNAPCLPISRYVSRALGGLGLTHGGTGHNNLMVSIAQGFAKMAGVTGVRVNQALVDLAGKTISRLRPDVQYVQGGLIHIVEVSTLKGAAWSAYHLNRERMFKVILGSLFGSYTPR